jgi:hypothetical protein
MIARLKRLFCWHGSGWRWLNPPWRDPDMGQMMLVQCNRCGQLRVSKVVIPDDNSKVDIDK